MCDFSSQTQEGVTRRLSLFAYCVVFDGENEASFDEEMSAECVPVPLKIEGPERPVALLPNRTGLPAERFLKRQAYIAVDVL